MKLIDFYKKQKQIDKDDFYELRIDKNNILYPQELMIYNPKGEIEYCFECDIQRDNDRYYGDHRIISGEIDLSTLKTLLNKWYENYMSPLKRS